MTRILLSSRALRRAQEDRFDFAEWARTQAFVDTMTAQIGMADVSGLVFASTLQLPPGVNILDRPHFRAQVDPSHDSLFISRPVVGRVSKHTTIQFSRKLLDRQGEFAGVTVFSLDCAELSRFYEALQLGNGFVSLLSTDGTLLAHSPMVPGLIGTNVKESGKFNEALANVAGTVVGDRGDVGVLGLQGVGHSNIDRIVSFRRLKDYPVIVVIGLDGGTVFDAYWTLRRSVLLTGVIVTIVVSLIGFFWIQQKRRNIMSQRAMVVTLDTISQGVLMVDRRGAVPVIILERWGFWRCRTVTGNG